MWSTKSEMNEIKCFESGLLIVFIEIRLNSSSVCVCEKVHV